MFGRSAAPISSIRPRESIPRGICYVCASAALGAVMSVAIKWLATKYPAIELSFFRCVFGFIPVMLMVRHAGGAVTLRTRRPLGHFFRGAVWPGYGSLHMQGHSPDHSRQASECLFDWIHPISD